MALSKSITFRGLVAGSAYIRVKSLHLDLDTKLVMVQAWIYASAEARIAGDEPLDTIHATFTVDLQSPIPAQAYAALKALPALSGAVDV